MKLATLRTAGGSTTAALATGAGSYLALPATDVGGALLAQPEWRLVVEKAAGAAASREQKVIAAGEADLAPLLPPRRQSHLLRSELR